MELEQQPEMPDDAGQIASDGFITVGSAPAPRQQTPAGTRTDRISVSSGLPDAAGNQTAAG